MATLHEGFQSITDDKVLGLGVKISDIVKDLRARFATGSPSAHRHDGTSGDGPLLDKTSHATVPNRAVGVSIDSFRLSTNAVIGTGAGQTIPYLSLTSSVKTISFGVGATLGVLSEIITPSDYSTTVQSQAINAFVRSRAGGTVVRAVSQARVIGHNVAITADLTPTSSALGTGQTNPQRITMPFTYATLAKRDLVAFSINKAGGAATLELFGAYLNYTADE